VHVACSLSIASGPVPAAIALISAQSGRVEAGQAPRNLASI
jgi:hypothetical protein